MIYGNRITTTNTELSGIYLFIETFNNLQIKSISYLNKFYSQQMDYMYG